jgi:DNA repair photolyase
MILAGVPAPSMAPRLGREVVRERGGVEYRALTTRSLVNRCVSKRMFFQWTVNPYRGCAMGCRYCYATYTHEYLGVSDPDDFHTRVYFKTGGEEETARRVNAVRLRGEWIALGTATDPYQPGETELGVTRRFLEICVQHRGLKLMITTKGAGILHDLELLVRIRKRSELRVHLSLISPDADLLRRLEPLAPPPVVRIEMMRRLVDAGIEVSHTLAPILPGITDREADLDELMRRVREAGVRAFTYNPLFLRSPTREKYLRFVAAEFPRYLAAYQHAYARSAYLGGTYRKRLRGLMEKLRAKHGFVRMSDELPAEMSPRPAQQLGLFA